MYKYTVSKQIMRGLRSIRKAPYVLNKEYHYVQSHMPSGSNYTMHSTFTQYADGFEFYSPKKLREVPLHGIMFPVEMFDEEIV